MGSSVDGISWAAPDLQKVHNQLDICSGVSDSSCPVHTPWAIHSYTYVLAVCSYFHIFTSSPDFFVCASSTELVPCRKASMHGMQLITTHTCNLLPCLVLEHLDPLRS